MTAFTRIDEDRIKGIEIDQWHIVADGMILEIHCPYFFFQGTDAPQQTQYVYIAPPVSGAEWAGVYYKNAEDGMDIVRGTNAANKAALGVSNFPDFTNKYAIVAVKVEAGQTTIANTDMWLLTRSNSWVAAATPRVIPSVDENIVIFDGTEGRQKDSGEQLADLLHADGSVNADYLPFLNTYVETGNEPVGATFWDSTHNQDTGGLVTIYPSGTALNHGEEIWQFGKNTDSVPILEGDAVMVSTAAGSWTAFKRATSSDQTAYAFIGVATMTIPVNGFGRVTVMGDVHDLNTTDFDEGKPVYLDAANPGKLTKTYPTPPNYVVNVGMCLYKHANHGIISVISKTVPRLSDLSDMKLTTPTTGDELMYFSGTWRNYSIHGDNYAPQGWDAAQAWSKATVSVVSTTKLQIVVSASANITYYWRGQKRSIGATSLTVTSTEDKSEGIWYCYSTDGTNFVLSKTPFYIFDKIGGAMRADLMLWEFYWDNTNNTTIWIQPEFHPSAFYSPSIHGYAHESFGTRYANGLDITYGTTASNNDTRLKFTTGEIHDEGISGYIVHSATPTGIWEQVLGSAGTADADYAALPIYYRSGADASGTWRKTVTSSYPFLPVSNNYIYYNRNNAGTWDYSTSAGSSSFVVYWIVGTTNQSEPIVVIPGRLDNANLTTAQAEGFPSLTTLFTEYKLLYRIIYQTSAANSNNGKCKIASVTDYRRDATANNAASIPAINASQVVFAPAGNIAATNVQAAIEELDAEKVPVLRTLTGTAPIEIEGSNASQDLTANRTISIVAATSTVPGSMSAADKAKLDLVVAGTYTPSLNNVTNVASSTASVCQYMRVGSVVTVSGSVVIDPTATGATELGMSLPIASNLATTGQCAGTFANQATTGNNGCVAGDTTNDRARFLMMAVDAASRSYFFTFTYLIV